MEADLPIMRRRRGRRKNVEGLELLFMGNKRAGGVWTVCLDVFMNRRVTSVDHLSI